MKIPPLSKPMGDVRDVDPNALVFFKKGPGDNREWYVCVNGAIRRTYKRWLAGGGTHRRVVRWRGEWLCCTLLMSENGKPWLPFTTRADAVATYYLNRLPTA